MSAAMVGSGEIGSLEGVTLLHSPDTFVLGTLDQFEPDSATRNRIIICRETEKYILEVAKFAGATTQCVDEVDEIPEGPNVYWQSRTYFAAHDAAQKIQAEHGDRIPSIPRIPVPDLLADESKLNAAYVKIQGGGAFVIAYNPLDNGHIKYFIDQEVQLDRFMNFIRVACARDERIKPGNFELRPFLETRSSAITRPSRSVRNTQCTPARRRPSKWPK